MNWKKRVSIIKVGDRVKIVGRGECGKSNPGCCNRYFPIGSIALVHEKREQGGETLYSLKGERELCNQFPESAIEVIE